VPLKLINIYLARMTQVLCTGYAVIIITQVGYIITEYYKLPKPLISSLVIHLHTIFNSLFTWKFTIPGG